MIEWSIKKDIKTRLKKIEQNKDIRILLAVESGSRSWGFESLDSDYDVRFIYAHRPEWYLSIEEKRDVIGPIIDGNLDFAGWDLRKALRLFRKSNPVLMEWIVSPYVYTKSGSFTSRIRKLAEKYYSKKAGAHHYLNMAESNYNTYIKGKRNVNLKKYFYVLRPLVNIYWLMEKDGLIPLSFVETLNAVSVSKKTRKAIDKLMTVKKSISELGKGKRISEIDDFIKDTMKQAKKYCKILPASTIPLKVVDELFRSILDETWR